jgi:signal transduction histidine kinase
VRAPPHRGSDTGTGIALEDLERIFQPFVLVDGRVAREQSGTGLKLSLVRRFVELHGASVHVESAPGQGSRFIVTVPVRTPTPASPRSG